MSSLTADVESPSSGHKNDRLTRWVEEVAQMCKPERVHWCDGSPEEYQALLRLMVLTGTAIPLNEEKRPNSFLVRSVFFSSRRRHTRFDCDWSSDVCSSDLGVQTDARQRDHHDQRGRRPGEGRQHERGRA